MSWEYAYLKRELGLPAHALRDAFERWCVDGWDAPGRTEWSVRFGERVHVDRFVRSLRVRGSLVLRARLFTLAAAAGHEGPLLPMSSADWNRLVLDRARVAGVAFACEDGRAALDVQLGLEELDDEGFRALAASFPGLARPPGAPRLMIAATLGADGPGPRLLGFYDADQLALPEVRAWMGPLGAATEGGRRVAVSLSPEGPDAVWLEIAAPGAPRRRQAEAAAADVPLLAARMRRATWCRVPVLGMGEERPVELTVSVRVD